MKPTTCPYLGLMDDPETHLGFPSLGNCCRRARPVEQVSLEHQSTHCLCMNYAHCAVLANSLILPLPDELRISTPVKTRKLIGVVISAALILVLFGVGWWKIGILVRSAAPAFTATEQDPGDLATPSLLPTSRIAIPNLLTDPRYTSTLVPTEAPSPTETQNSEGIPTIIVAYTNTPYPIATETVCVPPSGWVIYVVQPNDSLFHIGLDFGVTVRELQEANCLGNSVVIYTGQRLYVPNIPTRTPSGSPTRIPTATMTPIEIIEPSTETPAPIPTDTSLPTDTPYPTPTQIPSNTPNPTLPPLPTGTLTPPPNP